jgi:hypothetical protein
LIEMTSDFSAPPRLCGSISSRSFRTYRDATIVA